MSYKRQDSATAEDKGVRLRPRDTIKKVVPYGSKRPVEVQKMLRAPHPTKRRPVAKTVVPGGWDANEYDQELQHRHNVSLANATVRFQEVEDDEEGIGQDTGEEADIQDFLDRLDSELSSTPDNTSTPLASRKHPSAKKSPLDSEPSDAGDRATSVARSSTAPGGGDQEGQEVNEDDDPADGEDPDVNPNPAGNPGGLGDGDDDDPDNGGNGGGGPVPPRHRTPARQSTPNDFADKLDSLTDVLTHAFSNRNSGGSSPNDSSGLRKPDQFDGRHPDQLNNWLFSVKLNLEQGRWRQKSDYEKVLYAISYLTGVSSEWFQVGVMANNQPPWVHDYDLFVKELRNQFGPYNEHGDAVEQLAHIKMSDSQHITDYDTRFVKISLKLRDYGEGPLHDAYYHGLTSRIKDMMAQSGKPSRLAELCAKANLIDRHYWERRREQKLEDKSHEAKKESKPPGGNSGASSLPLNNNRSGSSGYQKSSNPPSTSSLSNPGSKNSDSKSKSSGKSKDSQPDKPAYLDANGHLTQEERTRRMTLKLCLRCGEAGHRASDCPKNTKKSASGRAANVEETSNADSSDSQSGKA